MYGYWQSESLYWKLRVVPGFGENTELLYHNGPFVRPKCVWLTDVAKFNHLISCWRDEALGTVKAFQMKSLLVQGRGLTITKLNIPQGNVIGLH